MIHTVAIARPDDLQAFRRAARGLLGAGIAPADVAWTSLTHELFAEPVPDNEKAVNVPRSFGDLADAVICHRDEQRWPLLYQALWRIDHGERNFMERAADPLLHRLRRLAAAVKHDQHRMTAFVRFRGIQDADGEIFIAWYEPRHYILRRTAFFFIDRFASMRFSILTPDLTLHWDRQNEQFAQGPRRDDAPSEDAVEDWWRKYYASIFNPSRINTRLMRSHMPKHFWHNLPEARSIPSVAGGSA